LLRLKFDGKGEGFPRILCLGAHSDDIEIGCGGTILRLIDENPDLEICWVVWASGDETRRAEAEASASLFLKDVRKKHVILHGFRDGFFPYSGGEIKEVFQKLETEFFPDIVFTHHRHDLHQDHRMISELTWNSFRNHLIMEYEIPKYDGDLGSPNAFVPLESATCDMKIEYLLRSFVSQNSKYWFTGDTFRSMLRIRGVEARSATSYAEGFYCRKFQL